jgi:hypothetical protein
LQFDEALRESLTIGKPKLPQAVKCNRKLDFGYRIRRIKQQIRAGSGKSDSMRDSQAG